MTVTQNTDLAVTYAKNRLYNQSFEEGLTSYAMAPGNNYVVYCGGGGGYGTNCFLEFSRGSGDFSSVSQDVATDVRGGDNYTVEAMLRCPPNQPACPITMTYWGLGITAGEARSASATIPADGRWYHCRVDYEHGGSAGFAGNHNVLRLEVYNNGPTQLVDVDFTSLELYVNRVTGTQSDPLPPPSSLGNCFLAGQYGL